MMYALIGERLGHSYSKTVHEALCDYEYQLREVAPQELDGFLRARDFRGLNVTIPYKQAVIPYVDELTDTARAVGAVNTLYFDEAGKLWGDNTDVYGFQAMLASGGIDPRGKKALVLGSGGTSLTARYALRDMGAREITVVSRTGEVNYQNVYEVCGDAELIVNTTPVGMFPRNGERPIDLRRFSGLQGVADVIYNPARTGLLQDADALGIPRAGGLTMLVAQAARSAARFTGQEIPEERWREALETVALSLRGVALVGMPGSGKSSVARAVADRLGRECVDLDREIVARAGCSIPEIFARQGEAAFREMEAQVTAELSRGNAVLATGGGCVLRPENREALRANSLVVWLGRDVRRLPRAGRPLSTGDLSQMERQREPSYRAASDLRVENDRDIGSAADAVVEALKREAAKL